MSRAAIGQNKYYGAYHANGTHQKSNTADALEVRPTPGAGGHRIFPS